MSNHTHKKSFINVWSLISGLFIIYGLLILGAGLYYLSVSKPPIQTHYHPSIWWGAIILVGGLLFLLISRKTSTPESLPTDSAN